MLSEKQFMQIFKYMSDDAISECKNVSWEWRRWVVEARWSVVHGRIERPPRPAKVSARRNGSADDNGDDELIFRLELD